MELSSRFVGTPLRTLETWVTARQTMNYAAATGDFNPCYFDDTQAEGVIAPPMMAVALTWQISGRIWDYLQAEDFPREVLLTQVHYTEHLRFHRPVRPGDHLLIRGKVAAIIPRKAGTLVVVRFDALDEREQPVFTEHIGGMMRGVRCLDGGAGSEDLPPLPEEAADEEGFWEAPLTVDPLAPFVYDGCTDIHFPIHTSAQFARDVGLPGIILQGTATLAFAVREMVNREAGGDPARMQSLACRFTGMVLPGSIIRIRMTGIQEVADGRLVRFIVLNGGGEKAIRGGIALLSGKPRIAKEGKT
jgi:acyl dehydratase